MSRDDEVHGWFWPREYAVLFRQECSFTVKADPFRISLTPWILEERNATLRVCASEGVTGPGKRGEKRLESLKSLRRGEGRGYIGLRRLRVRLLPLARAAVAQRIEQRRNTWTADSCRESFWCREGERYFYRAPRR